MFGTQGKPIKCQAAVAWCKGEPLSVETVEVLPPEKREVRVKIVSVGICHTDASYLEGVKKNFRFPAILGHEGAGIVESIGEDVTMFKPGDHVIPLFVPQCQECDMCRNPETNLCAKMINEDGTFESAPKSVKCKGKLLTQMVNLGCFSEYTVVPEIYLTKIDERAPLDKMALFGCCLPTGFGAAVYCAKVHEGSSCAVWGLGGVGVAVVLGCRFQKAKMIIGVDINPDKFEFAKKMGCTHCLNPKDYNEPIEQVIQKITKGGADYTFVSVGHKASAEAALNACHSGWGKSILIGLVPEKLTADPTTLLMGRKWIGTCFGDARGLTDVPQMVSDYLDGKIPADELITHEIRLEDINKGFELLRSGRCLRAVIIM